MVVGTVIDPEMSNQMRVTVVATGLGRPALYGNSAHAHRSCTQPQMRVVAIAARGADDAVPTTRRSTSRRCSGNARWGTAFGPTPAGEDLLDIPAFLRRQAD